ncbi:MAG: FAD-dependent oxidoreductase [Spirochaetota bacterium]|nr:FAD-dependent oxidoreductase [Spirochaetota bacterium]
MRDRRLDPLFEPLKMPNLLLKNRLYMAPMGTGYNLDRMTDFLVARAKGGVGLITTGEASIHPSGRAGVRDELLIETDDDIKPLSMLVESVHRCGAKIVLQLNHAGRYSPGVLLGRQSVAPSPIMSGYTGETPRELATEEVDDLIIIFAEAALRARRAGFDGIELMGSSGYLISQFLSPLTNKRKDKYGGDTLARASFLLSILRESRARVGDDFNICVKFDADDGMQGGRNIEDSLQIVPHIVASGADRLHVWAGWHESSRPMLPMSVSPAAFSYMAAAIKGVVDIPISTVGRINDPFVAAEILVRGEADLIGLGRALLCDPDFVQKTWDGRDDEIRRCTACCYCFDQLVQSLRGERTEVMCGLNPESGREGEGLIRSTKRPKRLIIVGGGPAGMETARIAATRGHFVTIYEKDTKLGGMLNLSFIPPHKGELRSIIDYYTLQMDRLQVRIKLGTPFTIKELNQANPDVVILATGARSIIPDIPGIRDHKVLTALDALRGNSIEGKRVLVIGGGMIGLETAEFLAENGKEVTIIEISTLARDVGPTNRGVMISRLRRKVRILTHTEVVEIEGDGVIALVRNNKKEKIMTDAILIASGLESRDELGKIISTKGVESYSVGSCREPGQIAQVIADGFNLGCII